MQTCPFSKSWSHSLCGKLNATIAELLERRNMRPFQKLDGCRRSAFEAIDSPAMKPMPARRYELADWRWATVNVDCQTDSDCHLRSGSACYVGSELRALVAVSSESSQ